MFRISFILPISWNWGGCGVHELPATLHGGMPRRKTPERTLTLARRHRRHYQASIPAGAQHYATGLHSRGAARTLPHRMRGTAAATARGWRAVPPADANDHGRASAASALLAR